MNELVLTSFPHLFFSSFDKTKVLCLLLHSCDVSHPAKRWDVHWQWTARCIEEFFEQGDREAELGLEYSPLCDRHNTMVPQSQIGECWHFPGLLSEFIAVQR